MWAVVDVVFLYTEAMVALRFSGRPFRCRLSLYRGNGGGRYDFQPDLLDVVFLYTMAMVVGARIFRQTF